MYASRNANPKSIKTATPIAIHSSFLIDCRLFLGTGFVVEKKLSDLLIDIESVATAISAPAIISYRPLRLKTAIVGAIVSFNGMEKELVPRIAPYIIIHASTTK